MNHLAHLTRQLTRNDLFLEDGLVLVTDQPLKPAALHAPPPHVLSQRRMLELIAPESSASSSSAASSTSSPLSSLPTALSVTELEEKLARALLACRAALEESGDESDTESSDGSCDDDDEMEDDEFVEDDECSSLGDAVEEEDDDDEAEDDEDDEPVAKPDDTYHRRMRRVCAWRDTMVQGICAAAVPAPSLCPPVLSRKRKADDANDCESDALASSKRARMACPSHTCTACGWAFATLHALRQHGEPANPSEACRAAVAYQLEA